MRVRLDAARCMVRALRAARSGSGCVELASLVRRWDGVVERRWRKRLIRHTRTCAHCLGYRRALVAAEHLLLGASAVPVPAEMVKFIVPGRIVRDEFNLHVAVGRLHVGVWAKEAP